MLRYLCLTISRQQKTLLNALSNKYTPRSIRHFKRNNLFVRSQGLLLFTVIIYYIILLFRILPNICDGTFMRKYSYFYPLTILEKKKLHHRCLTRPLIRLICCPNTQRENNFMAASSFFNEYEET